MRYGIVFRIITTGKCGCTEEDSLVVLVGRFSSFDQKLDRALSPFIPFFGTTDRNALTQWTPMLTMLKGR